MYTLQFKDLLHTTCERLMIECLCNGGYVTGITIINTFTNVYYQHFYTKVTDMAFPESMSLLPY